MNFSSSVRRLVYGKGTSGFCLEVPFPYAAFAPGQSVLVTITVLFNDCTPGLFFFRGPINTHTITWAC